MIIPSVAAIPIFFTILAGLVLWFVIGSKGHWLLKSSVIIAVPSFCFLVWISIAGMLGWPVPVTPEGKVDVIWYDAVEPNKSLGREGCIRIWVKNPDVRDKGGLFDLESDHIEEKEPRAYTIPYSEKTHEDLEKLKAGMAKGHKVRVEFTTEDPNAKRKSGGPESPEGLQMYVLPPPKALKGPGN